MSRTNARTSEVLDDRLHRPKARKLYEREVLIGSATQTIASLLASQGITQRELARRLGVSPGRVSQIVSGKENLTLETLASVAWALGIRFELDVHAAPRSGTPAEDDPSLPSWAK